MRVALDLDNCLLEWQYHWAELYQQWFDREIDAIPLDLNDSEEVNRWFGTSPALYKWDACLTETHFDHMDDFYDWFEKANGWATQPWVPGAQGFLYDLDKVVGSGYSFVTSRPTAAGQAAAAITCAPWGGGIRFANNTSKHLVKADFWVDDSPEVLASLAENGKKAIRFARPWNVDSPAFAVANSWADVWSILKDEGL